MLSYSGMVTACRSVSPQFYKPRAPQNTLLYKAIISHFDNFTALTGYEPLPSHIESEFSAYIRCGIRAYGFARLKCTACDKSYTIPFSCYTKVITFVSVVVCKQPKTQLRYKGAWVLSFLHGTAHERDGPAPVLRLRESGREQRASTANCFAWRDGCGGLLITPWTPLSACGHLGGRMNWSCLLKTGAILSKPPQWHQHCGDPPAWLPPALTLQQTNISPVIHKLPSSTRRFNQPSTRSLLSRSMSPSHTT